MPPGCRSAALAGRSPRRSRTRPGLAVRALGDRLEERLRFCLDIHHEAGLSQLLLQLGLLLAQPGDLRIPRTSRRTAPRPRAGQRTGVTGPPPLDHVTGIQALAAQHRALLT